MQLIIDNKLISLAEGSKVKDEQGNDAYIVKGRVFSITRKKFIYDLSGNHLFTIRNKYWKLNPFKGIALIYDGDGKKICSVTNKFFSISYVIKGTDADYVIEGQWFKAANIKKNGNIIGTLSRKPTILWNDSFVLEADADNIELCLAFTIAVDNISDAAAKK